MISPFHTSELRYFDAASDTDESAASLSYSGSNQSHLTKKMGEIFDSTLVSSLVEELKRTSGGSGEGEDSESDTITTHSLLSPSSRAVQEYGDQIDDIDEEYQQRLQECQKQKVKLQEIGTRLDDEAAILLSHFPYLTERSEQIEEDEIDWSEEEKKWNELLKDFALSRMSYSEATVLELNKKVASFYRSSKSGFNPLFWEMKEALEDEQFVILKEFFQRYDSFFRKQILIQILKQNLTDDNEKHFIERFYLSSQKFQRKKNFFFDFVASNDFCELEQFATDHRLKACFSSHESFIKATLTIEMQLMIESILSYMGDIIENLDKDADFRQTVRKILTVEYKQYKRFQDALKNVDADWILFLTSLKEYCHAARKFTQFEDNYMNYLFD